MDSKGAGAVSGRDVGDGSSRRPRFSIVAPAYKTAPYLPRFIASVQAQGFDDWELVIVDDGSPDDAANVLGEAARADERVVPVIFERNRGTHVARKRGVEVARGDYVILFDSDDELVPGSLRQLDEELTARPVDILHFGTELEGQGALTAADRENLLTLCNRNLEDIAGAEAIVRSSFVLENPSRQDWGILRRVCRTGLLKRAFRHMADERLVYGEDAYELLVLASLAREEHFRNDIVTYRYCLGRGITSPRGGLSEDQLRSRVEDFGRLLEACRSYADSFSNFSLVPYVDELEAYHLMTLMNEWHGVGDGEARLRLANEMFQLVGAPLVATNLCRLARDDAYADWDGGLPFNGDAPYLRWVSLAEHLVEGMADDELPASFAEYHTAAVGHIHDLRERSSSGAALSRQVGAPEKADAGGRGGVASLIRRLLARIRS